MSEKVLVSACLIGQPVRYDGQSKGITDNSWLTKMQQQQRLVVLCPEVAGGLAVPRPAAEQRGELVITQQGLNVTDAFARGAAKALELCQHHNIKWALLKANSPSCGNHQVYDGHFRGQLIDGAGVTTKLLRQHGIHVFNEHEITELQRQLTATANR